MNYIERLRELRSELERQSTLKAEIVTVGPPYALIKDDGLRDSIELWLELYQIAQTILDEINNGEGYCSTHTAAGLEKILGLLNGKP